MEGSGRDDHRSGSPSVAVQRRPVPGALRAHGCSGQRWPIERPAAFSQQAGQGWQGWMRRLREATRAAMTSRPAAPSTNGAGSGTGAAATR